MRKISAMVTEKTYNFFCKDNGKEKEIILTENLKNSDIEKISMEMGGEVFYNLKKTEKVMYYMPIDEFVKNSTEKKSLERGVE